MDIFNDKNVYVYTENDTVFILPKDQDKPVKFVMKILIDELLQTMMAL